MDNPYIVRNNGPSSVVGPVLETGQPGEGSRIVLRLGLVNREVPSCTIKAKLAGFSSKVAESVYVQFFRCKVLVDEPGLSCHLVLRKAIEVLLFLQGKIPRKFKSPRLELKAVCEQRKWLSFYSICAISRSFSFKTSKIKKQRILQPFHIYPPSVRSASVITPPQQHQLNQCPSQCHIPISIHNNAWHDARNSDFQDHFHDDGNVSQDLIARAEHLDLVLALCLGYFESEVKFKVEEIIFGRRPCRVVELVGWKRGWHWC